MISGIGVDLVSIDRFRNMTISQREKMAERILDSAEFLMYNSAKDKSKELAKYWAVKEAVSKSFGTGIRDAVVWKNIILTNNKLGKPLINFRNELSNYENKCQVSISHEGSMLIACAILTND